MNEIIALDNKENSVPNSHFSLKERVAVALIDHVQPTHFITLSLNQARQIKGEQHGRTWVRGDDVIYTETHRSFIHSLSKRLTPRTSWDFHRPLLRSACVVEGGRYGVRNHLHMIIAKPDHVDEEMFRIMVLRTAANNTWIMNDDYAVDIQSLNGGLEAVRAAFYSIKKGVDRLTLS